MGTEPKYILGVQVGYRINVSTRIDVSKNIINFDKSNLCESVNSESTL